MREDCRVGTPSRYHTKFDTLKMLTEYACPTWSCYLADGTDVIAILTIEEQIALAKPASPIVSAEVTDIDVP